MAVINKKNIPDLTTFPKFLYLIVIYARYSRQIKVNNLVRKGKNLYV